MIFKQKISKITHTALFLALLLTIQFFTHSLSQLVTGSLVNSILILTVLFVGTGSGVIVALCSPVFAYILGIGPIFIQIVPAIMLGNCILVLVWGVLGKKDSLGNFRFYGSIVIGAVLKFSALYFIIVKLLVPFILNVNETQAAVISKSFSLPQLFTALLGGIIASILYIPLHKALYHSKGS